MLERCKNNNKSGCFVANFGGEARAPIRKLSPGKRSSCTRREYSRGKWGKGLKMPNSNVGMFRTLKKVLSATGQLAFTRN